MAGKLNVVKRVRKPIDEILLRLPLPNVHPNVVSGLSLLTSIAFLFSLKQPPLSFTLLLTTILLDWIDGVIARKYKRASEEGALADLAADRFSEALIFIPFFVPWFYLFVLNTVLTIRGVVKRKHFILPLRHVFVIYYFIFFVL